MKKFLSVCVVMMLPLLAFNQALYNKTYTFQDDCPMLTVLNDGNIIEGLILCDTRFRVVTDNVFSFTDGIRTVQTQYGQTPFADGDAAHAYLIGLQQACGCSGGGGGGGTVNAETDEVLELCDDNGAFLRRIANDGLGNITIVDTELDGTTAYATVGAVVTCSDVGCVVLGDNRSGQISGSTQSFAANSLNSLSLLVTAGTVDITYVDISGSPTTITVGSGFGETFTHPDKCKYLADAIFVDATLGTFKYNLIK